MTFSAADVVHWSVEDAIQYVKRALPADWRLELGGDSGYLTAEIYDKSGLRYRAAASPDPKLVCLDCLGWLLVRNQKPAHPAWRTRERELPLRVPNPSSDDPDPPDLDPREVAAVYNKKG